MTKYTIFSIPFKVNGLEYLKLLHSHTSGVDTDGSTFAIKDFSWSMALLPFDGSNEKRIVHIHWETNIYGSKYVFISIVRMLYRFTFLCILKMRGCKIVWTIHNISAHDYKHHRVDSVGRWLMWRFADTVIIQEDEYAKSLARIHKRTDIVCIPQGNYVDIYGELWKGDRNLLRSQYGLKHDEVVLLSLGSIRPYKAIPELIEAVEGALDTGAPVHLYIAGKVTKEYEREIRSYIHKREAITLHPGFVPDEKIPEILAMADYTVFYYGDSSLSSAAMILSLSYGTPVITRDIPASKNIVAGKTGYVFSTKSELQNILMKLPQKHPFDKDSIIDSVRSQDWDTVTQSLRNVYRGLFSE